MTDASKSNEDIDREVTAALVKEGFQVLVVEIDEDTIRNPALQSVARNALIIHDNRVVAVGRLSSSNGLWATVSFDPRHESTNLGVFANDLISLVPEHLFWARQITFYMSSGGQYEPRDESDFFRKYGEARPGMTNLTASGDLQAVDEIEFIFGIASQKRFGHIPGFGVYNERDPKHYGHQIPKPTAI